MFTMFDLPTEPAATSAAVPVATATSAATALYAVQALVVEYISPAPAVLCAAPAPIDEYITPATAVYVAFAHVVEYTTTAPDVFYATPALEVKYLAPVPLSYAAPVAAETVGFGSSTVEPDALDAKIKFFVAETLSGVGCFESTHTETVLLMNWEAELCVRRDVGDHSASL